LLTTVFLAASSEANSTGTGYFTKQTISLMLYCNVYFAVLWQ